MSGGPLVARGKVMNAYKNGQDIPEGWALDAAGAPTTNAKAALEGVGATVEIS